MLGDYLVDTNLFIDLMRGKPGMKEFFDGLPRVILSVPVFTELYYGALKSGRTSEVEKVEALIALYGVTECDADTGRKFGEIKKQLADKGRPIPENDIWIAALALQHDLVLKTRDGHFKEVSGLNYEPV